VSPGKHSQVEPRRTDTFCPPIETISNSPLGREATFRSTKAMSASAALLKRPFELSEIERSRSDAEYSMKMQKLDLPRSSSEPYHGRTASPNETSKPSKPATSSSRPSPLRDAPSLTAPQSSRTFDPDSTLVIIGQRGAGKSSLAIIAAAVLRRRFVDVDQYFEKATGLSRAGYIDGKGMEEYRIRELELMRSMLEENRKGCVIAGVYGILLGNRHSLLRQYSTTNPVVYILRDKNDLQRYVQISDEKMQQIIDIGGPLHRASSNFEFYNLPEAASTGFGRSSSATTFLKLKELEQDFIRFLAAVYGKHAKLATTPKFNSFHSLSRKYTYALDVPFEWLGNNASNLADLDCGGDAVNFSIRLSTNKLDNATRDSICKAFALLRRTLSVPIIYCVKEVPQSTPDSYFDMLHLGLRLAPDYLTISLNCTDDTIRLFLAAKGQTKTIATFFDDDPGPDGWSTSNRLGAYNRATKLGFDFVILSQDAKSTSDNLSCLQFIQGINSMASHIPVVAYNSGPMGRMSVCFNPILSPVSLEGANGSQITLRECQKALYSSFTLEKRKFFIFGSSVSYSLSPAMHNAASQACSMPHTYEIYQTESFEDIHRLIEIPEFGGSAITLPFKREILSLLQSLSPEARIIGAVNTLVPIRSSVDDSDSGSIDCHWQCPNDQHGPITHLHGCNTDWIGVYSCIHSNLSPANIIRPESTALVIGAGGMARAAVFACLKLGLTKIVVHNRSVENAAQLAGYYNALDLSEAISLETRPMVSFLESRQDAWPPHYNQPTVIVSCIPAHSIGGQPPANFALPDQWLQSRTGGVVVEVSVCPLRNHHQS
jgi:shikimate 5-dehydrogenase/shikimate kinase/3-dehydroquinate dehydratase